MYSFPLTEQLVRLHLAERYEEAKYIRSIRHSRSHRAATDRRHAAR